MLTVTPSNMNIAENIEEMLWKKKKERNFSVCEGKKTIDASTCQMFPDDLSDQY